MPHRGAYLVVVSVMVLSLLFVFSSIKHLDFLWSLSNPPCMAISSTSNYINSLKRIALDTPLLASVALLSFASRRRTTLALGEPLFSLLSNLHKETQKGE